MPDQTKPALEYLQSLAAKRASGEAVPEESFYGPLEALLDTFGHQVGVRAVMQLADRGAGHPDGGLFDAEQLSRAGGAEAAFDVQLPTHGAVEVKPAEVDLDEVLARQQIRQYREHYGSVLVTNLRQFQLVTTAPDGSVHYGERFSLADDAETFWALASGRPSDSLLAELMGYLRRTLAHRAPITRPSDLAAVLAGHARSAMTRVESGDLAALSPVREALAQTLGISFDGEQGERFFRSTLVQTLFYGVFSAWVLAHRHGKGESFDWRHAAWWLRVPMTRALFEQVAVASRLRPLGLDEVLDWTGDALRRVHAEVFFSRFRAGLGSAVQDFYEPFLSRFDPVLREELGVWYTPPEVVRYQVEVVDRLLREEFGISRGLADPSVYVLDPCTGTGSYLVAVLERIEATLRAESDDDLVAAEVKAAALSRIAGFELLPAPFVVAHLQLGMQLNELGAPLTGEQRAAVYLTNALTGWEEPTNQRPFAVPEFAEERDAADEVKRQTPILVVLGNPPYNGFAGVATPEEGDVLGAYKQGLAAWGISKNKLDDLYIRFWRVAERRIVDGVGHGIVSYISNFSWLHDPSAVIMRLHLLGRFDTARIDCLNGDSRETGKRTPDGHADPSVFADSAGPGIQVGTAVSTLVRRPEREDGSTAEVFYRDFWGRRKRELLLKSLKSGAPSYERVQPVSDTAFAWRPQRVADGYHSWPRIDELAEADPMLGLNENRRGALIGFKKEELQSRIEVYFSSDIHTADLPDCLAGLREAASGFDPLDVRAELLELGMLPESVRPLLVRPLDLRWGYVDSRAKLWNRSRPELQRLQRVGATRFLLARRRVPRAEDGAAFLMTPHLVEQHAMHKDAYLIPLRLPDEEHLGGGLFNDLTSDAQARANLSGMAREWLANIGIEELDGADAELPWLHALTVGYSPAYLADNRDGGRYGFQRIPLPADKEKLRASAATGERIAELLDVDHPVDGVTRLGDDADAGFWRTLAAARTEESSSLDDPAARQLRGWASVQRGHVVMPATGQVSVAPEASWPPESLDALAARWSLKADDVASLLGSPVRVHLNSRSWWDQVPRRAWELRIGGYSVLRKWLSYRDSAATGEPLSLAQVREFTDIVRRLTALLLLATVCDRHYEAARGDPWPWPDATRG